MSVADAGFDIKSEYEAAKETAHAYLQAMDVLDSDEISTHEWREHEARIMRDAIRKVWNAVVDLPNDPVAREAVMWARRFCPSSKQMGLLSVFHKGGSGSSLFDVKPLGFDGSSGGFGWSVF